jgi:molybdenum cofactor cytidylyltransferase
LRIAAIILAAGKSSRMGANKLLFTVGDRVVLVRLIEVLIKSVDEVVVVTGYDPEPIAALAQENGAYTIHNPDHEMGMTTSFQAGLKIIEDADAFFLVLGDQIGLKPDLMRKMKKVMEDTPNALIVSPVYLSERGHPVLFRANLRQEILALSHGESIKDVVERHMISHFYVEGDEWNTIDFDTPGDFERAKKLFEKV